MTFFITENYLRSNGIINLNVDATQFTGLIQFAAKAFVKKEIGSYFFDDLLTKYNLKTLSIDETALVEVMQWAIAWRAKSDAGIELTYQLENKGYQKQSDDNSQPIDLNETTFLTDRALQKTIFFQSELKSFLLDNKELYPNYLDDKNKDSSIKNDILGKNEFNEGVGILII